ncbi:unnamed protein product [Danaus chrysippus]|uniref:(African queen) hypothetical protein n=1 Tax=Danaus chrysippus TaxID=151541 RepID=A0A8J2W1V3_9NEOP|nr:unnamed protein product [Danaus chrysippus]
MNYWSGLRVWEAHDRGDLVAIEGLNRARNERGGVWWWRAAGVTSQRAYTISMATSAALGGLAMVWGGH